MCGKVRSWEEAVLWLRSQPDSRDLVKASYYDDPLEVAADRFHQSEEWVAVRDMLKLGSPLSVLDLGAGRGISSYAFAREGCVVTALEPNPSEIVGSGAIRSLAKTTGMDIRVFEQWGESLPFPDGSFDIVYGRAVLHHAKNLGAFCSEAARVLKPGGIFFASREHVISRKEDLSIFLDSHPLHKLYGGENAFLFMEYTEAIRSSGLRLKSKLGPFDSPVNYAPTTMIELREILCRSVRIKAVSNLACKVLRIRALFYCYLKYLTVTSDIPGRLYTFLAVKPCHT